MIKGMRRACVALLAVLACSAPSERADSAAMESSVVRVDLDAPVVTEDACEGEVCQSSYPAVACREVALLTAPRSGAARATILERGDTIDVRTDLHLKKPGIVVLKREVEIPDEWNTGLREAPPPLRFAAGDTLLLLNYIGEGFWKGSHNGRVTEVLEFWGGPGQAEIGPNDDAQAAVAIGTRPEIDTWLRVSRGGEVIGWWLKDDSDAMIPIGEYGEKWGYRCKPAP